MFSLASDKSIEDTCPLPFVRYTTNRENDAGNIDMVIKFYFVFISQVGFEFNYLAYFNLILWFLF